VIMRNCAAMRTYITDLTRDILACYHYQNSVGLSEACSAASVAT
jgi:hypothetical protein